MCFSALGLAHKFWRKSHMKNLKVCIASSALAAALALAPASALAEGATPAPTSATGVTATAATPTREQLMDPTVNPYAPEDAYFLPDVTNPIPDGFMVGNADGVVIVDNGDGTVTVKGHWTPALDFDEVIEVQFVRIPDPTPAPTPDPTPAPTPDPEPAPAPEPEPAPAPAPTPEKKSTLPATGIADVVVPASVLAVSGLGFVAASRKVRK